MFAEWFVVSHINTGEFLTPRKKLVYDLTLKKQLLSLDIHPPARFASGTTVDSPRRKSVTYLIWFHSSSSFGFSYLPSTSENI